MKENNRKMKKESYRIAELVVEVNIPDTLNGEELLPSFVPFRCSEPLETGDDEVIASLQVCEEPLEEIPEAHLLAELPDMVGEKILIYEGAGGYMFNLWMPNEPTACRMKITSDFTSAEVYIGPAGQFSGGALSAFLMIQFAQASISHRTFLIHASVVMKDGKGYAFLGKSGTGKSTHSALWIHCFYDVVLLNDDNPAITLAPDGVVYVSGTPWSGKTPCYKNIRVPLSAYVRLEQALLNRFSWKQGLEALMHLIPSCCCMRWNERLYSALCDLMTESVRLVPVGHLHCRADRAAAFLCLGEMEEMEELQMLKIKRNR